MKVFTYTILNEKKKEMIKSTKAYTSFDKCRKEAMIHVCKEFYDKDETKTKTMAIGDDERMGVLIDGEMVPVILENYDVDEELTEETTDMPYEPVANDDEAVH